MTVKIFKNRHDGDVSAATPDSNFVPSSFFSVYFFFVSARIGECAGHGRARSGKGADA